MAHAAYRIGIGAGVLALIAAAGLTVIAADPPAGAAPETKPSASGQSATKPMAKAIATGDRPAIVTVETPPGPTRSLGGTAAGSLQITVRPEAVERSEPYLVNVYVLPAGTQPRGAETPSGGPAGQPGAPSPQAQPPAAGTLIGSFSFFPPPRAGEERTFTLPSPQTPAPAGANVSLKVELVPSSPGSPLQKSTLAIVDAKIGPP
jgi:hypothetical protein